MVQVSMNIEDARGAANFLGNVATGVEGEYTNLSSEGSYHYVSTEALVEVPNYVQTMRDMSKFLDGKVDLAILINSNSGNSFQDSGTITYEVDAEATTLDAVESELGEALAKNAEEFVSSDFQEDDPRLAAIQRYMAKYAPNDDVMENFYDTLTPEGTLALVNAVGEHMGATHNVSEEERNRARLALLLLKRGLAVASEAWPEDKAQKFGANLVDSAPSLSAEPKYYKRGNGIEALAWLMYDNADLSDSFVLGAAEKMHEVQQQGNYSWEWIEPSHFLPAMVKESDVEWALDIPSVAMHGLGQHPSAAFGFFDGDGGDERLDYWTNKHYYSSHSVAGTAAALDAASTDPTNMSEHPERAAEMASWAVNCLTQNSDYDDGDLPVGASFEHVLETYMPGVHESITDREQGPVRSDGSDVSIIGESVERKNYDNVSRGYQPVFNERALAKAIATIGNNGQAMIDMAKAVQDNTDRAAVETSKEAMGSELKNVSRVEGFFEHAIGASEIAGEQEREEKARAWVQLLSMPVSTFASAAAAAVPGPAKEPAGWAASILVDNMKEGAIAGWESQTRAAITHANHSAGQKRADLDANLLLALAEQGKAGYQTRGEDNGDTAPLPTARSELIRTNPDGTKRLITRAELNAMSPEERECAVRSLREIAESSDGYGPYLASEDVDEAYDKGFQEGYY